MDDDGGQAIVFDHTPHLGLGEEFGALVCADHVGGGRRGVLVGGLAVPAISQRGDAGSINDPLDAGGEGGPHEMAGTIHVGAEHGRRIAHPQPVIGSDVKQRAATGDGSFE